MDACMYVWVHVHEQIQYVCMSICVCLSVGISNMYAVCMNNLSSRISTYTSLAHRHHCKSNKHQRATQIFEAFHGISHARFWSFALFRLLWWDIYYSLVLHPFYKRTTLFWSKNLSPMPKVPPSCLGCLENDEKICEIWGFLTPQATCPNPTNQHPGGIPSPCASLNANSLPDAQLPLLKHLFLLLGVPWWWPWSCKHLASAMLHFKSFAKTGPRDD